MRIESRLPIRGVRAVVCLIVAVAASTAWAQTQQYKTLPLQPEARGRQSTVQRIWDNPAEFQNAQAMQEFDSYFNDYLFPSMTQTSADKLAELSRNRGQLMRWLGSPTSDPLYQHLNSLTLQTMQQIATDNYLPAVRYNAMLIIGSLDQKPGDPRPGSNQPPVPLPEALDFMLQMLAAGPARAPDILKVGALIGLERHARFNLPEEKRQPLTDELIKTVASSRPSDRTGEIHAWLQWRAAEILAQLGSLGENNRVHDTLVAFMNDDSVPVVNRMYAAKSLEKLKDEYTPQAGIDAAATVAALGNVLVDLIEDEEKEAYKFIEEDRAGLFQFDPFLEGEPPGYPRGRLLQRINYVLDSFAAVEGALNDETKQQVQAALAPLRQIRTLALDRTTVDLKLAQTIEASSGRIQDAVIDLGRAAAPPAADEEDADPLAEFGNELGE